jgi:fibronectin-binding autotransporter adhesin
MVGVLTRVRNNQVYNNDIDAGTKLVPYSITGGLWANNLTYNSNLTVGNLTVNGLTTTLDSTNLVISDPLFVINRNASGTNTYDLGIVLGRGNQTNVAMIWEETNKQFQLQYTTETTAGLTQGVINNSGYANLQAYGISLNNATIGTSAITNLVSGNVSLTGGSLNNVTIGATTPNTGVFTSITTSSGGQLTGYLTGAIGANTPNTGVFTSVTTGSEQVNGTLTAITLNAGTIGNTGASIVGTTGTIYNTLSAGALQAGVIGNTNSQFYAGNLLVIGNTQLQNGLAVNSNGTITTDQTTFNLINTTATTINLGAAATTINLAKTDATSAVKVNGTANSYGSGSGALQIAGGFYAAGDSYIQGNLTVGNLTSTGYTALIANSPLLYLEAPSITTYNYEVGFYSHKTDAVVGYNHMGLVRNHTDNLWYLFSNIRTEPTTTVDLANAYIIYDTLKMGNLIIANNFDSASSTTGSATIGGGLGVYRTLYAGSIQNTPIGNGTASTGAFTTLTTTSTITSQGIISAPTINAGTIGNIGANLTGATVVTTGNIYSGGNLVAAATTTSTSTTTGSIVAAGGIGIAGNINVGANSYIITAQNVPSTYTSNIYPYSNSGNINIYTVNNGNLTINPNALTSNLIVHGLGTSSYYNLLTTNAANNAVGIRTVPSSLIANAGLYVSGTDSIVIPAGTTAQRPSGIGGMIRYNSSSNQLEFFNAGTQAWTGTGSTFTTVTADSFTGTGSQTNFTLSQSTTTAGVIVAINGVIQIPITAYSVSGTTLTFTEAPLSTDIIDARSIVTTATVTSLSQNTSSLNLSDTGDGTGNVNIIINNTLNYVSNNASNYFNNGISTLKANVSCTAFVPTVIDTFSTTAFRGAKYVVSLQDYTNYNFQLSEVIMVLGNSNATVQTYGVVAANGTSFCNFYANVSGTTAQLYANSSTTSVVKVQQIYMPI